MLSSKEGKARNGCENSQMHHWGCFLSKLTFPFSSLEINIPPFSHKICQMVSLSFAIHWAQRVGEGTKESILDAI